MLGRDELADDLKGVHSASQIPHTPMVNFARLGELTGGMPFAPKAITLTVIRDILRSLVMEVRTEYVAGFTPDAPSDKPSRHKIEIHLRDASLGNVMGGSRTIVH